MPRFTGFGDKALPFLTALKFHQSKPWFDENRTLYESELLEPMTVLLDELSAAFVAKRVPLKADGRRSIFRIHRDVRFSKNKSPYKTHCGAVMTRSGSKNEPGLLYVHIEPQASFVAAGFHMPEPADLARLRKFISADHKKFATLEAKLASAGLPLGTETQLTRVPRGFEAFKGSSVDGALRLKSFIVEEPLSDKLVGSPKLAAKIVDFAARARPLLVFGWEALGVG
jgi:uncharacterized protein (TIGR02453 family)